MYEANGETEITCFFFSQLKSAVQNKTWLTFLSKISVCHVNWRARLAQVIPAHLDYFMPRMLRRVKVCVGKQGEEEIHAVEPGSTLTQSRLRVVVQQMLSKTPTLWDVRSQDLLSFVTLWLHTYCLEIGFSPQFWPRCKNVISFRAIWFRLFHRHAYAMNSGRTKAFAKKKEQVHLHSYHQRLKWEHKQSGPYLILQGYWWWKKSALSTWFYFWFPDSCKTNDFHFSLW